jgi:hypothetical protein
MFWIALLRAHSTLFCRSEKLLMPKYGLFGPRLKAQMLRKSLKAHWNKRHWIGSLLVVRLGLKNAGDAGMPDPRKRAHIGAA